MTNHRKLANVRDQRFVYLGFYKFFSLVILKIKNNFKQQTTSADESNWGKPIMLLCVGESGDGDNTVDTFDPGGLII